MHQDHEIERRHNVQALASVADAGGPVDLVAVQKGTAQPELVTVEVNLLAVDLWICYGFNPVGRHDLVALPGPVVGHELADLGEVSRALARA